jgi:hypothetical protein
MSVSPCSEDDGRVKCAGSVCHTCVRVEEGTRAEVQCGEEQEIIDFADAVWGVAGGVVE